MEEGVSQLAKFGMILGIICLAATLVLAVTYEITKPKIEAQLKNEESAALKEILPGADTFKEKSIDGIEYFDAMKSGSLVGYCIRVVANGYSGYIRIVVGIDRSGLIKGVQVLEQYETPGLGSKITEVKQGEKDAWFLRQFKGKSASTVTLKKDVDAITGATISSSAVTNAIRETVTDFLSKVEKR
jgi:electron transport complex protein RnfG